MAGQKYISDELTHFAGGGLKTEEEQFRLLIEILKTGWLRGRDSVKFGAGFTMRTDPREPLMTEGNKRVPTVAVCFCDIPLGNPDNLMIHKQKYSRFGLTFAKQYMLSRGASPAFYVATDAVPPPSHGIGPRTLGEKFDLLHRELTDLCFQMDQFAFARNPQGTGGLHITFKHSPEGTPEELKILGKLNTLVSDLDQMVFSRLKPFEGRLAEDHKENYYMEREWRVIGCLKFQLENVRRIILPRGFEAAFKEQLPAYTGEVTPL